MCERERKIATWRVGEREKRRNDDGRIRKDREREVTRRKRQEKTRKTEERKESERGVGVASGKIKESSIGNPERGSGLTEASTDVY